MSIAKLIQEYVSLVVEGGSYTYQDIPRFFYLVTHLPAFKEEVPRFQRNVMGLQHGVLHGVKGISSSKEIISEFMIPGSRNTVVMMPGIELLKLNKFTRVNYDNPHYMLSNNMSALRRVQGAYTSEKNEMMQRISYEILSYLRRNHSKGYLSTDFDMEIYNLKNCLSNLPTELPGDVDTTISGVKSIHKFIVDWLKTHCMRHVNTDLNGTTTFEPKIKMTPELSKNLYDVIYKSIQNMTKKYQIEGEWINKGNILVVPPGSRMLIATVNRNEYDFLSDLIKATKMYSRYQIRWTKGSTFNDAVSNMQDRRKSQET